MRRWAVGGLASAACVCVAGVAWSLTTWDDLRVVETGTNAAVRAPTSTTAPTTTIPRAPRSSASPSDGMSAAPSCEIADDPVQSDPVTDWARVVVDAERTLPSSFVPPDLVDVSAAGFNTGDQVRQIVVADLQAFRLAAEANGTPIVLASAYRSYEYQQGLFEQAVEETGLEEAQLSTARPGHSEHQLGTAIDLTDSTNLELTADFAETPTGRWVSENAHLYGFVVSYPDVARQRSCYSYEPWHLRYVGRDIADDVRESGLTLREWQLTND